MSAVDLDGRSKAATTKLIRHEFPDRLLHWAMAACVLVLLGSAFLPILGWNFAWVNIHWITGLVLTGLVIAHTFRALIWQDWRSMWIGAEDARDALSVARWSLRISTESPRLPGKYSLAQKLIHHLFTLVVGTTIVTGCLMLVKIDTPWWERDPYWLSDDVWGVVYVLHDFAALLLITMIMAHVYFALRPEKLHFTRSMILGWISRSEYEGHHDEKRWKLDREN